MNLSPDMEDNLFPFLTKKEQTQLARTHKRLSTAQQRNLELNLSDLEHLPTPLFNKMFGNLTLKDMVSAQGSKKFLHMKKVPLAQGIYNEILENDDLYHYTIYDNGPNFVSRISRDAIIRLIDNGKAITKGSMDLSVISNEILEEVINSLDISQLKKILNTQRLKRFSIKKFSGMKKVPFAKAMYKEILKNKRLYHHVLDLYVSKFLERMDREEIVTLIRHGNDILEYASDPDAISNKVLKEVINSLDMSSLVNIVRALDDL